MRDLLYRSAQLTYPTCDSTRDHRIIIFYIYSSSLFLSLFFCCLLLYFAVILRDAFFFFWGGGGGPYTILYVHTGLYIFPQFMTLNSNVHYNFCVCHSPVYISSLIDPTPPPPPPPPPPSVFPPSSTYQVPPNSVFEIIYGTMENGEPSIIYNGMEITDSNEEAYRLLKNESLDCTRSLVHLRILILDDTYVTFHRIQYEILDRALWYV